MKKDKLQFIANIIEKNKFTANQKERFVKLALEELKHNEVSDNAILKGIEEIKEKLGITGDNSSRINETKIKSSKNQIIQTQERRKIHDPTRVVNWLKLFTQDNTHIKFSNHPWDDLDKYENIKVFFDELNSEYKEGRWHDMQYYSPDLYWSKIYPFLFQKELTKIQEDGKIKYGWGKYKIKIGWQYPKTIKVWSNTNYDAKPNNQKITPYEMKIPDKLLPEEIIDGKTIQYFEDVVDVFKKEIEFRDNDLYYSIMKIKKKELNEFSVKGIESLKGHCFFTNTECVLKAIERIFKMIKKRTSASIINISAQVEDKLVIINICQDKSYSDKPINHPKILLEKGSGDFSIITKILFGLCDFSIESRFKDKENNTVYAQIDYLFEGINHTDYNPRINIIDASAGFKYILRFPL